MNQNKVFGIIGIAGVAVLLLAIVIAIVAFEDGVFSPLSGFYSELGLYTGGYFSASSSLVFNVGMMLFGLTLCASMIFWGIRQNSWSFGTVSFFGILTGVLAASLALFSLNFSQYHYTITAVFSVAAFLFGASYIAASMIAGRRSIAPLLVAFFAAICSALFAGYVISGGMTQVFIEDASMVGRLSFMPFAVLGWLSLLLLMALLVLLSLELLQDRRETAHYKTSAPMARRSSMRDFDF